MCRAPNFVFEKHGLNPIYYLLQVLYKHAMLILVWGWGFRIQENILYDTWPSLISAGSPVVRVKHYIAFSRFKWILDLIKSILSYEFLNLFENCHPSCLNLIVIQPKGGHGMIPQLTYNICRESNTWIVSAPYNYAKLCWLFKASLGPQ